MKTITYAAAFAILVATAACDQSNQGGKSSNTAPNTAAQQNGGPGPTPPGNVPSSEIRQLRENVLTNQ